MTYWTDPIAVGVFYAAVPLALALATRAMWRAWWRRDDQRQAEQRARLETAVKVEHRTADTVDLTDRYEAAPTLREETIPMPGMVTFRGHLVHVRCVGPWLRNGAVPCGGCARHLRDDVRAGAV